MGVSQNTAVDRKLLPGMAFETTLLGRVYAARNPLGDLESIIPASLQYEANEHGFEIVAADYKRNAYSIRILSLDTSMHKAKSTVQCKCSDAEEYKHPDYLERKLEEQEYNKNA